MGVAFAEVSPDFCFCFNTRCHRGAVFAAAGGVRHCYVGRLYVGRLGMGTVKRFYHAYTASLAGGFVRAIAGTDAIFAARIPSRYPSTAG